MQGARRTTGERGQRADKSSSCAITLALPPSPVLRRPYSFRPRLLGDAHHHAGADGLAALADGEALLLLHREGGKTVGAGVVVKITD